MAISLSVNDATEILRYALRDSIKRNSIWHLIQGVILIFAGVLSILYPLVSATSAVAVLGWLLIASGITQAISLIGARRAPHFWLQLISGGLAALVGSLILTESGQSLTVFTVLLIVFFMIEGLSKIVFALTMRPLPNWGWVFASGVLGIALALLLWGAMPMTKIWLIGLMLGVQLIAVGSALTNLALELRRIPVPHNFEAEPSQPQGSEL